MTWGVVIIIITKRVTLKLTEYFRVTARPLGQFLANKQTERFPQVLGPTIQDIKHTVIDNQGIPSGL